MHLKQKAHSFGVLLVFTIITITLSSSGGWCQPTAHPSHAASPSALYDDGTGASATATPSHPSGPEDRRQDQTDTQNLDSTNQTTGGPRGGSGRRPRPRTVSPRSGKSFKNRHRRGHAGGEPLFTSDNSPRGNCSKGFITHVVPGKFYIPGHLETDLPHLGYQSDSGGSGKLPKLSPAVLTVATSA